METIKFRDEGEYNELSHKSRSNIYVKGRVWKSIQGYMNARSVSPEVDQRVLFEALNAKFMQNPELRKLLLSTLDAKIEYVSNHDESLGLVNDKGLNILGRMLMVLRHRIKKKNNDIDLVLPPWVAFPQVPQQDMFWRMGIGEDYIYKWAEYIYSSGVMPAYSNIFPPPTEWNDAYV